MRYKSIERSQRSEEFNIKAEDSGLETDRILYEHSCHMTNKIRTNANVQYVDELLDSLTNRSKIFCDDTRYFQGQFTDFLLEN